MRVEPPSNTVVTGGAVSYQCLANGTLNFSVRWMFGSTSLPEGVVQQGNNLSIMTVNRTHAGTYVCVVADDINTVMAEATLLVKCEFCVMFL